MNVKEYFEANPEIKYIIFGGKGGLGKTTFSAATAYWLANRGRKVVVFSTDPQASLTDIFEREIFGRGEVEIARNLYALEIDADKRIAEYQEEVRRKIIDMYGEVPPEIDEYIKSASAEPAMAESATFDAMVELMTSGKYDYYIFDMMPHGHAVRFLSMSQILDVWIDKVVETRRKASEYGEVAAVLGGKGGLAQEDAILKELEFIRSRLDFVGDVMRDRRHTAFFYVLIPEAMAILDTERALKMFQEFKIPLSGVIINQVYPVELLNDPCTPDYLKNRILMQQKHMETIRQKFGNIILGTVPMLDREPKGLEMISKIAQYLFGGV